MLLAHRRNGKTRKLAERFRRRFDRPFFSVCQFGEKRGFDERFVLVSPYPFFTRALGMHSFKRLAPDFAQNAYATGVVEFVRKTRLPRFTL
jgi:hypothetical protein